MTWAAELKLPTPLLSPPPCVCLGLGHSEVAPPGGWAWVGNGRRKSQQRQAALVPKLCLWLVVLLTQDSRQQPGPSPVDFAPREDGHPGKATGEA